MADYSQVNDYSDKDALATGNPLKLIKGSDVDAEFSAIATAISSKYDSTDIATAAEAQAGVSNTVIITPARLTAWGQNDGGLIEDIQKMADPGVDSILFWDNSAVGVAYMTAGTGINFTGTEIEIDESGFGARTLTAGVGLSGGGDLSADRTFTLALDELGVETTIAAGDFIAMEDITDNGSQKITFANFEAALTAANLIGYDANDNVDHTAVTITAGSGLSYSSGGTNISASATIDLDINELTSESTITEAADYIPFYDASAAANRKGLVTDLLGDLLGDGQWYRSSAFTVTTEATLVFDAAEYDALEQGTFSTSTGEYTRGADAGRIRVYAKVAIQTMDDDDGVQIQVQVNGTTKLNFYQWNDTENDTPELHVAVAGNLNLAASDVVRVRVTSSSSEAGYTGTANTYIAITELS